MERFLVGDGDRGVDQREIEDVGDEVFADAFDQPRARVDFESVVDLRREDGPFRIGEHHLNRGVPFLQIPADAAHRAARADARDEGVDVAIHLCPDLRPGGLVVGLRIGVVGELVDVERIGVGGGDAAATSW